MTLLDRIAPETFREGHIPLLETERLVLRAPRDEDAKAIATLINDRRIAQNTLRIPHPYALADAEAFIASANRAGGETPEIGYWLGVPHWGKGYATEAARAVIDHAFADLGCDTLLAGARVSNPASRRVLEKCGFQWTSVGLYRIRALKSSAPIDRFRLDRGLWASLKSWGTARR